ncbi:MULTISPECIES: FAD-dependent monooxygenase [unclassified Mycobacterium]|uniref:FAD-dependent monooxygenase n=1 Tax=unclassified Mycobacterium TaxID=2642494 RepID=UPI000A824DB6|nr:MULTISPECIES: FAD-dependent monooxygenase [unclassified Mycobacterium]
MPNSEFDTDVVICGGGPVGLAHAYLLGRSGIDVQLFERRSGTTPLPKGQYIHASTGELYRQWGVWDLLEGRGWPIAQSNGQGFYVTVNAGPVGGVRQSLGTLDDYIAKWSRLTPVYPRKVAASDYESALLQQARQWSSVDIRFHCRVVDVTTSGPTGITTRIENVDTGETQVIRSRYLVACDGAHSFIRNRIGRGQCHGPAFENQILVEFVAPLEDTLGQDGFFHSFVLHPRYAGWFGSQDPTTGLWRYSFKHDEEDPPAESTVVARIRGAIGDPSCPIEVKKVMRFDYSTGLLRSWREGNIFFAGDAAHWHSPWGGFGQNTGVQDANNLAWKLALVLQGHASDSLLDTYEVERKSKALQVVKLATYNAMNYQALSASVMLGEHEALGGGRLTNEALAFLTEHGATHGVNAVLHTGFQLGTFYTSSAIIRRDRQPPPPGSLGTYVESIIPGARAPHAWLRDPQGRKVSTSDLWGPNFTLAVSSQPELWTAAVVRTTRVLGIPISLIQIGNGGYVPCDKKYRDLYTAPVLVRPDGHIAWRYDGPAGEDCVGELISALKRILALEIEVPATHDTHLVRVGAQC